MTDLIACTRELYEAGWSFDTHRGDEGRAQFGPRSPYAEWMPVERKRIDGVRHITDRWNCGDPTANYESWFTELPEPVPPVITRMNDVIGVPVRSADEAVAVLAQLDRREAAELLTAFWKSEAQHLGPGEQVTVLDIMDALDISTLPFLDADIAQLASGTILSDDPAWTRFAHARAIMRRREQRRDPADMPALVRLAKDAVNDTEAYATWTARILYWLGNATQEDRTNIEEVIDTLIKPSSSPNMDIREGASNAWFYVLAGRVTYNIPSVKYGDPTPEGLAQLAQQVRDSFG